MVYKYTISVGDHFKTLTGTLDGSSPDDIKNQIREIYRGQQIVFGEIKKIIKK